MMDGPLVADTAYFVALARAADQHHRRAADWQRFVDRRHLRLVTTDWVLLEVFRVLRSERVHAPLDLVIDAIEAIRADPGVEICPVTPELRDAGWARLRKDRGVGYSWEDATTIEIALSRGLEHVLTFDHGFQASGLTPLLRAEPGAYA